MIFVLFSFRFAETRHYVKENFPSILESYYQVGEFISGDKAIRNHDELIWKQEQEARR